MFRYLTLAWYHMIFEFCFSPWHIHVYLFKIKWPHPGKTFFSLIFEFKYLHLITIHFLKYIYTRPRHLLYLLYQGKISHLIKALLLFWNVNRIKSVVKNIYFNSCLIFGLLNVIYDCFKIWVLFFGVYASGHSDPLLLYSAIFVFCCFCWNHNIIVCTRPFRMVW